MNSVRQYLSQQLSLIEDCRVPPETLTIEFGYGDASLISEFTGCDIEEAIEVYLAMYDENMCRDGVKITEAEVKW